MNIVQFSWVVLLALAAGVLTLPNNKRRVRMGDKVVYVGAVVEYEPYDQLAEDGGEGITLTNAAALSGYATKAKEQGADIMVTPEYALQGLSLESSVFSLSQYVPDPDLHAVPCDVNGNGLNFKALKTLSCAAQANQLYLVVDVAEASPCSPEAANQNPFNNVLDAYYECPSEGRIYYNTQVVFDRSGAVIARYRKKNLYLEPHFKPGLESDEAAIFMTDFGVSFSLQVCFDIAYLHPGLTNVLTRGVRDVAMSTAWVDILPFFLAPSVQNGWSRELGVNLLVSGLHLPERAKLGSGIYRGYSDLNHKYVYDPDSGNKLIVSEVETIAAADGVVRSKFELDTPVTSEATDVADGDTARVQEQPRRKHLLYHDDISNYTNLSLAPSSAGETQVVDLCHNEDICCSLTYTSSSSLNYSLLAYSGPMLQGHGSYAMYIQVCAVVWCKSSDFNTCTHITDGLPPNDKFHINMLYGNFTAEHVFPVTLTRNLTLVDNNLYSIINDGKDIIFTMQQETHSLLSAGLFGRWYSRDPSESYLSYFFEVFIAFIVRIWNSIV